MVSLVRCSDAIAGAEAHAQVFAEQARDELRGFPESEPKRTLLAVCDYVVERRI